MIPFRGLGFQTETPIFFPKNCHMNILSAHSECTQPKDLNKIDPPITRYELFHSRFEQGNISYRFPDSTLCSIEFYDFTKFLLTINREKSCGFPLFFAAFYGILFL